MSEKLNNIVPDVAQPHMTIAGREFVLEKMCAFKVAQILKVLSRFSEDIRISDIVQMLAATSGELNVAQIAGSVLPRLLAVAPDALMNMLALVVIPNAELASLADTPGAIEARVKQEAKFFNFTASPDEVVELASLALPLIGLDALKKSLPALGQRVMESLGVQLPQPSTNSQTSTPTT